MFNDVPEKSVSLNNLPNNFTKWLKWYNLNNIMKNVIEMYYVNIFII